MAGSHFVSVTLRGHRSQARRIEVERDTPYTMAFDLERTPQRYAALGSLLVGGSGLLLAGGLGVAALVIEADAVAQRDKQLQGPVSDGVRHRYIASVEQRDELAVGALAAGVVGAAFTVAGTLLFLLDAPAALRPDTVSAGGLMWRF